MQPLLSLLLHQNRFLKEEIKLCGSRFVQHIEAAEMS